MKILLLNLLMTVSVNSTDANYNEDYDLLLADDNMEAIQLMIADNTTEKVKIMDADGNLVREITKADFNTNDMEPADYKMLSSSSHMFDYLGDAYYLLEE